MVRNIISWVLIVPGTVFFVLSVAGIGAAWFFNEPLTRDVLGRLSEIDKELEGGQVTLKNAQAELVRTLRILDESEQALNKFTENDPEAFFENVQTTLTDELVPELETAKERLVAARDTLEGLRGILAGLRFIPFIQIPIPDQILTDLIDSADSLQTEIKDVGGLAEQASTFISDASVLLNTDLGDTRGSLESFLAAVSAYEKKIAGWRDQVADLEEALPIWIDRASIFLTIFLFWFALSQVSLFLHGRSLLRGGDPLEKLGLKKPD